MGDHVCEKAPTSESNAKSESQNPYTLGSLPSDSTPASPPPNPNYTTQKELPITRVRAPTVGQSDAPAPRPMRPAPPRINPDAANRPFLAPHPSNSRSPISPASSIRSGSSVGRRPPPPRSATSPMPRMFDPRPPSPELTGGYDCAFPPFYPGMPPSRPSTSHGHRVTSGERTPSRGGFRTERPSTTQGGPLNGPRKASNGHGPSPMSPQTESRRPSDSISGRAQDEPIQRPPTANSHRSQSSNTQREPPRRPSRPQEEVLSPTFLDKFSHEPTSDVQSTAQSSAPPGSSNRSQTFPLQDYDLEGPPPGLFRSSTEPLSGRASSASSAAASVASSTDMFSHAAYQQKGSRKDPRLQNAPPVPKAVQEHRQQYSHTPSQSSSSNESKHSHAGSSVSGPSPITSAASSFDTFSPLREEPASYGEDEQMRPAGLTFKQPESSNLPTEQKSPPRSGARPRPEPITPATPPKLPATVATPDESPVDPTFNVRVSHNQPWQADVPAVKPFPLKINTSPKKPVSPPPAKPAPPPKSPSDYDPHRAASPVPGSEVSLKRSPPPFPPPASHPPRAPPVRRPTTPGIRPVCRGCNKTIEGKSVKAADGRLTGRWHKQCFTCRTCSQPFATADFYVIENHPYCEHHYHEANGSLCAGCNRGIEGQYLETTTSAGNKGGPPTDKKFHPHCFTCVDCRQVLAEDYFEIRGRVYCERHALAAMRSQPRMIGPPGRPGAPRGPGLQPTSGGLAAPMDRRGLMAERRTTRLMVM